MRIEEGQNEVFAAATYFSKSIFTDLPKKPRSQQRPQVTLRIYPKSQEANKAQVTQLNNSWELRKRSRKRGKYTFLTTLTNNTYIFFFLQN
jgi:hypothetical protein